MQVPAAHAADTTQVEEPEAKVEGLEEIVVTAQKRAEALQDVPASVSVLDGDQLEKLSVTQLADYASYVPGLQVDSGGTPGQTQITLRGIAAASYSSSAVGTYIDDTPLGASSKDAFGSSFGLDLMPYDIERIEVLRGPQGTLYGASTMGGLLKYVLRSPELNEFSARVGVEGSTIEGANDLGWGLRAAVNVPISDTVAIRATYFNQHTPGYIDNVVDLVPSRLNENERKQEGGRLALLWKPTDAISVKLSALLQNVHSDAPSSVRVTNPGLVPVAGDLTTYHIPAIPFHQRLQYYSATVNWDFGWADLTSATSYSKSHSTLVGDFTPVFGPILPPFVQPAQLPLPTTADFKKVTQELRLTSPSNGTIEWMLGAFYTKERFHYFQTLRILDLSGAPTVLDPAGGFDQPSTYKEGAVFGNLTYNFTDQFDVTGGLRLARNRQVARTIQNGGTLLPPSDETVRSSETIVTFSLSSSYHLSEDTMIYARVASGYRPGGPNATGGFVGIPTSVDPDTLINYEAGVKGDWLDRQLSVSLTAFLINWKDIQISDIGPPPSEIDFIANGPSARSTGLEFQALYRSAPIRGLSIGFNAAYTNAKLTGDGPDPDGAGPGLPDLRDGARLALSPRFSGAVTAEYEFPLSTSLTGRLNAGYRYVGSRYSLTSSHPAALSLPDYGLLDLSVALVHDRWTARVFASNVTDKRAFLTTDSSRSLPSLYATINQPRTLGVSLDVSF